MLVELLFRGGRRNLYHTESIELVTGTRVICKRDGQEEIGRCIGFREEHQSNVPVGTVVRVATPEDLERFEENLLMEEEAFHVCNEKIVENQMEMKLVGVESSFDRNKLTFYFVARKRVDFRRLVRDLASHFKVRIEMRQIGVRDYAKRLGGYGLCGRTLCCATFLREFAPVTLQTVRAQELYVSPERISGVCGRLMCCLTFEKKFYETSFQRFPRIGSTVELASGARGVVTKIHLFHDQISVALDDGGEITIDLDELQQEMAKKVKRRPWRLLPKHHRIRDT